VKKKGGWVLFLRMDNMSNGLYTKIDVVLVVGDIVSIFCLF
jgi:hypothetical protein